jgi:hypothetical protein
MAGSMAGSLPDAPPMCDVAQVRAAVARSQRRGRVALVIADNLKAHTPAGSLLVRNMLTELQEHLYLVYTPAYDPDANRICPVPAKIDVTIGRVKEYPPTRVAEQIGAGRGCRAPHVVAPDCKS